MKELFLLIIIVGLMLFFLNAPSDIEVLENSKLTFSFGFMLIIAYIIGLFFEKIRLPKLSGYMIAGLLFGPYVFNFVQTETLENMKIINQLALTFIALNAGGELKIAELSAYKRQILWLIFLPIVIILSGMILTIFSLHSVTDFLPGSNTITLLAIGGLFGTVSIARSPSSTIAVIQELKADGPFSETVLGVTVAIDFIVILLFAAVLSFSEVALNPGLGFDATFLIGIFIQIIASVVAGVAIGMGVSMYIKRIKINLPILLIVLAFLIYNISGIISHTITNELNITIHLEPLLIAITAGFYIQNYTDNGGHFIESIESSSLPIYVLFFAMAGAAVDINIIKNIVHIALILVLARAVFIIVSGYLAGKISDASDAHSKLFGMGFITQAGVSIGLAQEIINRFPDWGTSIGVLMIAVININQLIGPITFKYSLEKLGEANNGSPSK